MSYFGDSRYGGREPRQTMSPPPSSPPAEYDAFPPPTNRSPVPMRTVFAKQARILHPDLTPKDDFEILMLGSDDLEGCATTDDKRARLREEWTSTVDEYGSEAEAIQGIKEYLDAMVEPSGDKPTSDDPDARYIPIPQTNLSLRFWPGSLADAEYCMDFVVTLTRAPINVPDDYKVWIVPDPSMPWQQTATTEIESIEKIHGFTNDQIKTGEEKFILRDGLYCQLLFKKEPIMRFRVPTRAQAIVDDNLTRHPQP